MRNVLILLVAAAGLVAGQEKTETVDFPAGGLLRMKNSTGALTIEAWDKPAIEITTVKAPKTMLSGKDKARASAELDKVSFTTERKGNELVIVTAAPKHARDIDISYHLWVPRDTRLAIDHANGEINIEGVAADIEATLHHGEIFLYLPDDAVFTTKAKNSIGAINLPGDPELRPLHLHLGRAIAQDGVGKPHILDLKAGFGDIYILRQTPAPKRISE